jgi:hypothetical protein
MTDKEAAILALLEKHLPTKTKEKETLGEVFTPVSMIERLLDMFPASIWKRKDTSWLDPAAGIGNFLVCVFFRLMEGLKGSIPSDKDRARHILRNQLYMVEINPANTTICRSIFKELSDEPAHIHEGDFRSVAKAGVKGWPATFDCILGNPPYNLGGTKLEGTKRVHILFTELGLSLLSAGGYIGYICPPSYREAGTPMNRLFHGAGGHFVGVKVYGAPETFKLFKIQGRVDSFLYKKGGKGDKGDKGTTIFEDEFGHTTTVTLDLDAHIPNFGLRMFERLKGWVKKFGHVKAFRTTEMSTTKAATFGCGGRHKLLHLIVKEGRRTYKTRKQHTLASVPKLFLNGLGIPYVYYDKAGAYGPSQSPVVVLRPSAKLVNFTHSDVFTALVWGLRITGNNNLPYMFDYVPQMDKIPYTFSQKGDFVRFLGLTKAEQEFLATHFKRHVYADADVIEPCMRSRTDTRKKKKSV